MRPIAIFDMDGTLFDPTHRRHFVEQSPKDWASFFDPKNVIEDMPIWPTQDMLRRTSQTHDIHIVTARREADRDVTVEQLDKYCLWWNGLHIVRPDGCFDPDADLKRKWLHSFEHRDRIDFVVDDRLKVCQMWREEGLFVFQVAEGNF